MFVPAGHDADLRRDGPGGEARDQPPRRRVSQAGGGAAVTCPSRSREGWGGLSDRTHPRPAPASGRGDLALYIHWPFCVSKCPYCDFNSHVRDGDRPGRSGARRCSPTSRMKRALLPGRRLTSIFFGGGTPSLMPPATVAALIDAADAPLGLRADDIEITLEANPILGRGGALRRSRRRRRQPRLARPAVARRRSARLPRPRPSTSTKGLAALDTAQRHFDRVSFDLIYALPGDERGGWARELDRALALRHRPSLALPADHRARHALRHRCRRAAASTPLDEDRARGPVRADPGRAPRRPACPPTKSPTTPRPARRAATTSLTGATAIMPASAPARTAGAAGMRTQRHRKPENLLAGARAATATASSRKQRSPPREAADEALLMGLRLAEGVDVGRDRRAVRA